MFEAGSIIWRIQTVGKDVLKQDLVQSEAAAQKAGQALDKTGKKAEELGNKSATAAPKVRTVRQEIAGMSATAQAAATTVGHSMVIIGAAVVAASALTVKAAIDWETAWTGVTKTVDGSPEVLQGIEDGLRGLTSVLPASHAEIAAVAEAAGQLGVKAKDIVGFTKTMIDLGETTNLSADEAATSLAQLMNIFQTAPEDVDNLGASVVALGNNGASTERDIVQMSQNIAGAAKIIGLTEGETLGLANALASVGIEAQAGGSSISNIMIDIANAVSEKGAKLLEWAKLAGMGADEFAEKYRTKPAEALSLVIEGMGRLNKSGGDVFGTLSSLGQTDVRTTRSLLGLASSGDMLRKSLELGNKSWEENTALTNEAEKRYETTAAKLEMARNSIVDTAVSLGEHLLPAVEAVAGAVSGFSDFLGGLPPELQGAAAVLAVVVGGIILVGGVALLAVPKIVAFKQAIGTLATEMPRATAGVRGFASFMGGPWGIAITAAVVVLGLLAGRSANASSRIDELTDSLDENTGAITGNTRAVAVKQLADTEAFKIAERYGVALNDVTDAALGNQEAYDKVTKAVEDGSRPLSNGIEQSSLFRDAIRQVSGELDAAKDKHEQAAEATGENTKSTESATDAYLEAQKEINGVAQELDQLVDALNKANKIHKDVITSNIDYRDTLRDADEAVQNARNGVDGYSLTLDGNSEAGDRNMERLVAIAGAAEDVAGAILAAGGSAEDFTESLKGSREDLIQRAMDFGYTRDEAVKLADQILRIPTDVETKAIFDQSQAMRQLADYQASLAAFRASNSTITQYVRMVDSRANGGVIPSFADGGITYFANGGEHHVAQIARAGDVRVWAEPETGGEAYIPLSPAKRSTSVPVLQETAQRMGFNVVPAGARRGDTFHIYEAIDGVSTALAVQRRQSALGAV